VTLTAFSVNTFSNLTFPITQAVCIRCVINTEPVQDQHTLLKDQSTEVKGLDKREQLHIVVRAVLCCTIRTWTALGPRLVQRWEFSWNMRKLLSSLLALTCVAETKECLSPEFCHDAKINDRVSHHP